MGSGHAVITSDASTAVDDGSTGEEGRKCEFCGRRVGALGPEETASGERITHVISSADGAGARRVEYCSPSCFIRDMEAVAGVSSEGE